MSYTLIKFVTEMNNDLFQQNEKLADGNYLFSYVNNGFMEQVLFNDFVLWSSEDDERQWDGEKDEYSETVQEYCIKNFKQYVKNLSRLEIE